MTARSACSRCWSRSLQLARAVTDPELSDQVLASAYQNAMTIAGASPSPSFTPTQESE